MPHFGRLLHAAVLASLTLAVALPAASTMPSLRLFDGLACTDQSACRHNAAIGPMVEQMLAEQTARYGPTCVPPAQFKGIPGRVLIRDAQGPDSGVVRVVTLDTALDGAKAGRIYVLKACR